MRGRALKEGFLACAGLAVVLSCLGTAQAASGDILDRQDVPFAAQDPADMLGTDALLAEGDMTAIESADWRPEHTSSSDAAAPAGEAKAPEKAAQTGGADASDPEPDAPVVPSTPSPSHDPLDRPRPTTAVSTDPAKTAAPAEEPLPPLNAAIKAALDKRGAAVIKGANAIEQRKEREAVFFFYAAHGFAPAWSEGDKPSAAVPSVLARLAAAGEDALTVPAVPTELKAAGSPDVIADSDIALTGAVVAYARQATGSRIEPRTISPLIGAKPDLADPAEVVDLLIAAGPEAGDKLHAMNPADPRYAALRDKLAELRNDTAAAPAPVTAIESGPVLKTGMEDPRVPLLRSRLGVGATGDYPESDLVYDAAVAKAVAKFQRAHGLQASGALGQPTLDALNRRQAPSASGQQSTIIANMEMWRWLPRDLGSDRIEVNVPDYVVRVYHDNQEVASNRVVVGKMDTPTPLFSNTMKFLIVNPVWNVPQSIIKNEFNGGTHGFKARYVHGQMYLQQPAGPGNALGRIKFMFPNDYSVYLHDTPAKALFGAGKRAFSHGCVRVDKPFEFAQSVLNDGVPEGGRMLWSQKRLEGMLGTTERYVNLPKPLPIHIEYFTANVDDSGHLTTRDDVYGYAGAVASALGLRNDGIARSVAGSIAKNAVGRSAKQVADSGARDDGASSGNRRMKRPKARHFADRDEGRRMRQAYAPPVETARSSTPSLFGFLPF